MDEPESVDTPERMDEVERAILTLVDARGPEKSICPTEAARALSPEGWHAKLKLVRSTAIRMAREGRLQVLRKGKPVDDLGDVRGVIRLRAIPEPNS